VTRIEGIALSCRSSSSPRRLCDLVQLPAVEKTVQAVRLSHGLAAADGRARLGRLAAWSA
jgi:hypothetical protein